MKHLDFAAIARRAATAVALCGAASAWASVDTSSKPGGVYRLKPGIYVAQGHACAAPPQAAVRRYDGKGIGTVPVRACTAAVRARRHGAYVVDQTCTDAGSGRPVVQRQQVTVRDALTFTQVIGGSGATYRYCPVYQLPTALQQVAPQ